MEHQMAQQPIGMMQGQPQMQYQQMAQNPQMQQQMQQGPYPQGSPGAPTPSGGPSSGQAGGPSGPYPGALQQQVSYQHLQQQHQQQLQMFWHTQMQEIEQVNDFKTHQLPLARIKKIMKADEDVRMRSAEAPVLFAKACEMFILELTLRSWIHTEENKRRTLQKNDIAAAITRTDIFDFLVDIVPRDELKDEGALGGVPRAALPVGTPADALPYGGMYYVAAGQPQQGGPPTMQQQANMMGSPAMMVGRPGMPMDPSMFAPQVRPPNMPYMPPQGMQPMQQIWSQPSSSPGAPPTS
jgi:nuclear transcription factor Y gamma